jgi:hypothetical protein
MACVFGVYACHDMQGILQFLRHQQQVLRDDSHGDNDRATALLRA